MSCSARSAHFQHSTRKVNSRAWAATSILLAQSIVIAIPISLSFFIPFLLSDRLSLSFWQAYALGCAALPLGFFVHRVVTKALFA